LAEWVGIENDLLRINWAKKKSKKAKKQKNKKQKNPKHQNTKTPK
jgi:hypothetical protein